jgi:hypothetical protein
MGNLSVALGPRAGRANRGTTAEESLGLADGELKPGSEDVK